MSLLRRLLQRLKRDDLPGESAKIAYYFFLSLFPLILTLFAITGLVGGDSVFQWLMGRIQATVPGQTADFLGRFIRQITHSSRPGVLSVGLLLTIWSASAGVVALMSGLNHVYDVEESRSWWKQRLIALGAIVAMALLMTGGAVAIIAGPEIVRSLGLPDLSFLRWPLAFMLIVLLLWLLYLILPARDQGEARAEALVGALAGGIAWLGATQLFRLYVANFGSYSEVYGFVGAIIVLMLWLYLTAMTVLFGGEVAATLEFGRRERAIAARPQESPA